MDLRKAGDLFPRFHTTSKCKSALDSLFPFILQSKGEKKNLMVTVQKRGNAESLLLPAATCSLSAALSAYILSTSRVSVSVSFPFARAPEAGEAPSKPKVCF